MLDGLQAGSTAIRGGVLRTGGYVVSLGLALITAPLLVRHLGVGGYGVFITITALVTVVGGVTDFGLTSVGVREWATRTPARRAGLMRDLLGARIVLTLIGCAGAIGFALAAGYGRTRLEGVALACGGLVAIALQSTLAVPLQGSLRQGWVAVADIVRQVVAVSLIVVLIAAGAGLLPLIATAIPAGLAALLVTGAVARESIVAPALHPRAWAALLRDTLPFAAASSLSVVYLRATIILTSLVGTATQTGQFAAAFRILEALIGIPVLIVGALFPILARAATADIPRLRSALQRTFDVSMATGAFFAVSLGAGAPVAIAFLGVDPPGASTDALRILAAGLGCSFVGATCQFGLLAIREHRAILAVNATALALNVVLTLTLVPPHGAPGAAAALALSELAVAAMSLYALARSPLRVRFTGQLLPRIAAAAAAAVAAAALAATLGTIAAAIAAPAVFLAVAGVLGVLPRELRTAIGGA